MLADDQKVELPGVEGILVYRDFSDAKLFYCCSTRPSIARKDGDYQFTVVLYDQPRDDCAGMLSLVVDLKPDDATMKKATDQLRAKTPGAQLVPMPWSSGAVAAAIIGGDPVFAVPSLLGDNSAVLTVNLTTAQYVLLKNNNPAAPPISIVYSLGYEAFRPQYSYSIEFNETRFRDWVQKKCSANLLFVSFEKVETFEDLKQSSVIRVVAENETGEEPPAGFQRAFLSSLQSLLQPAPRFGKPPEASGNSWLIGASCSAVHDIQNIARRLDCNMTISGAVPRKIFIQGVLDGLSEVLKVRPPIVIPTNNPFTQQLTVRCHAGFDDAPLHAANVTVKPRNVVTPYSRVFDKSNSATEWPIQLVHVPGVDSATSYRCESYFQGNRPKSNSDPIEIKPEQTFLDILPSEFYAYRLFSVSVAKEFPWDLMKWVKLELRGPAQLMFEPSALYLNPTARSGQIIAFAPKPARLDDVDFKATYQPLSRAAFVLEGYPAGSTIFLNPLLHRVVHFAASKDFDWRTWDEIDLAVVPADANPQLWADGASPVVLTKAAPSAAFAYWYSDSRNLTCEPQFIASDPDAAPARGTPFETSEANVTISNSNIAIVTAARGIVR